MSTQFVVDEKGEKIAAVIPIEEYYELMEDLEDLAAIASQRDDDGISWEEVKTNLINDGLLSAEDLESGREDAEKASA